MKDKEFTKRINEMSQDIFPLDRMLPYASVFKLFSNTYNNEGNKAVFFKDRGYQKFREGYWSLFACRALDRMENKEHYICFPEDPANDVNFFSSNDSRSNLMNNLVFDIKEFTKYSKDFQSFAREKINPKRSMYGMIIGVTEGFDGAMLKTLLIDNENDSGVFIVVATSETEQNPHESRVIYLHKDKIMFDEIIDIRIGVDMDEPVIIFQDLLRNKL